MNTKDINIFESIQSQLSALYDEMSNFAKKSPNDAVNEFKLKYINNVLVKTNKFLNDKNKPFDDFELFNGEKLPTNSDVVLMLSQYLSCMEKVRADNIDCDFNGWFWKENSDIRTAPPKKVKP